LIGFGGALFYSLSLSYSWILNSLGFLEQEGKGREGEKESTRRKMKPYNNLG